MKSIRISDEAYLLVQQEATLMSRSIAQQFEHWVRLGRSVEAGGLTSTQVKSLLRGPGAPEGALELPESVRQAADLIAGIQGADMPAQQERRLRRVAAELLSKHFEMQYGELASLPTARRQQLAHAVLDAEVREARNR